MKRPPIYWNKAKRILSRKDFVLRKIIKKYKRGYLSTRNNPYFSLCRTIVGQQISTKAADSSSNLKKVGLSRQKVSYLKNIAKAFKNKSFNTKKLKKMNDDEAIDYITRLKGLGVWSAEMFLMFNLNRPDILPIKDIGLLRAISKNYKTTYPASKRFLSKMSKIHSGYRTVFTWYMWRSIDPVDVDY